MAFTEFYCQSGGSNLNAGSDTNNAAKYTSTNGNWSTVTNIFTPTDGTNPVAAGVAVGDFASIYIDGASVGVFVARVTAVTNAANGTITVSSTAFAGTPPSTSATARTIKVGGACKGPNGASGYPLSLGSIGQLQDSSSRIPRFNLKNDATYSITSGINISGSPLMVQGYGSSVGDGGKAIIDGGASTPTLLTLGTLNILGDMIVQNNGASGTNNGINLGSQNYVFRVVVNNVRGNGFACSAGNLLVECEAYACNKSNTSGNAGFQVTNTNVLLYCIAHDNTGSNNDGFTVLSGASATFANCIADSNGRHGLSGPFSVANGLTVIQSDFYNNVTDGIINTQTTSSSTSTIRNCNFIKNGGFGINSSLTTGHWYGLINNCGFGSGTQANGSGTTNNTDILIISGSITYASGATPWVDGPNGDWRINLPGAINAGRGAFTETASSYAGAIGYPDIGAAQHLDTQKSFTFGG